MSKTIHTPASLDEADRRLTNIERVLMTRGWERAAILATVVRLDQQPGRKSVRSDRFLTPTEYADRRIPGLQSHNTVQLYVQRWLDANGGKYPKPDSDIVLPDTKWPPVDSSDTGSRTTASNIGRQIADNPKLAEAAAVALADGAIKHVDKETNKKLSRVSGERAVRDSGATVNPGRLSDRGKSTTELDDEAFWAKVTEALNLLLAAKVKIAEGAKPPAHVEILMQILVPEQDWDEALRQEIGGLL